MAFKKYSLAAAFVIPLCFTPAAVAATTESLAASVRVPSEGSNSTSPSLHDIAKMQTQAKQLKTAQALPRAAAAAADATPILRSTVLARAKSWIDAHVPYCQTRWYTNAFGTYRQDCSGYVSMAWALGDSANTYNLLNYATKISWDQLQPGDALLWVGDPSAGTGHVMLFHHWIDSAHTRFVVWHSTSAAGICPMSYGATVSEYTKADAIAEGYVPVRGNNVVGDAVGASKPKNDFDGDKVADFATYTPASSGSVAKWTIKGTTNGWYDQSFGKPGDKPVPADYDGDGKTDTATFTPATTGDGFNKFTINGSRGGWFDAMVGRMGSLPVPADYDGDGIVDPAVYTPASGNTAGKWTIKGSTRGWYDEFFGKPGDTPVPADYDGDGKADTATFTPASGGGMNKYTVHGSNGTWFDAQIGRTGSVAVPADYDGDGRADFAVYTAASAAVPAKWTVLGTTRGWFDEIWGKPGDIPAPADYDGDGKSDFGAFTPAASASANNKFTVHGSKGAWFDAVIGRQGDVVGNGAALLR